MAKNKIIFAGETLIDLTSDTVATTNMLAGATAHDRTGTQITGTVSFVTVYEENRDPTSSDGTNGDIWLRL